MKSLESAASIAARVIRAHGASGQLPRGSAGRSRSATQPGQAARAQTADIVDELRREAAIEPEAVANLLDRLRRRRGPREIRGRISRESASQQEGDYDHPDQARQSGRETTEDQPAHGCAAPMRSSLFQLPVI